MRSETPSRVSARFGAICIGARDLRFPRPLIYAGLHMERAIPILPTNDLEAAKAFYVDGLGFRVTFEASADGRTGLLGLQRGTIELTLDCPMDGHGRSACVSLHVTDADAYYREWSAKVTPLRPPKNEEWGARTFDLLDPSGNTLFVIGPVR
jgi:catechol 2,3-dioxygenase-like lactoylglutathione lyase family enzyme